MKKITQILVIVIMTITLAGCVDTESTEEMTMLEDKITVLENNAIETQRIVNILMNTSTGAQAFMLDLLGEDFYQILSRILPVQGNF